MPSAQARAQALAPVAAEVFAALGVDFGLARRAGGWTNATWLGGGIAVRVAGEAGTLDLARETRLADLLPADVGYPKIIADGCTRGFQWVATAEIEAISLDDAWAGLDRDQRLHATRRLWARTRAVHRVDPVLAAPLTRESNPFYSRTLAEAVAGPTRLYCAGVLTRPERDRLWEILERHWEALPAAPSVLNHGDLSPVNALWNGTDVVSLLDFEFAVMAPVQLDLNELVKHAFAPASPDPALRELVVELARPLLRDQAEVDLLIGHSVQLEMWGLARELAKPGRQEFRGWEPHRMLVACAHTEGGCYAPLLEAL